MQCIEPKNSLKDPSTVCIIHGFLEILLFTESIKHLQARGGIEQNVLESYCWMYSTFKIPREYKGACSAGDQVLYDSLFLNSMQVNICPREHN